MEDNYSTHKVSTLKELIGANHLITDECTFVKMNNSKK